MPLQWFKNVKKVAVRTHVSPRYFFIFFSWSDVAETISEFYANATHVKPPPKTMLSNYDIDGYLHELGQLTREQDQIQLLRKITEKSTVNDLRMFIRLIQKDLVNISLIDFVLLQFWLSRKSMPVQNILLKVSVQMLMIVFKHPMI